MTTPFDDPQAELGWLFVQCIILLSGLLLGLSAYGLGGCGESRPGDQPFFDVPAPDTSAPVEDDVPLGAAAFRALLEGVERRSDIECHLIRCLNDAESTVMEAQIEGSTGDGTRYAGPLVFLFDTRDGLITALRVYGDGRLAHRVFGRAA